MFFEVPVFFIFVAILVAIVIGVKVYEVLSVIVPIIGVIVGIIVVRKICKYVADRQEDVADYYSSDDD